MKYGAKNGLNRLARAARTFAVRFAKGTRGNVAMMFGMALPVLIMISFGAVDIHQASKVKANLQDALDAAALAAARSKYTDDVNLNRVGLAALKANMPSYFKDGSQDTASFTLNDNRITANARVNVKVLVANIVLPPYGKLMDDYLPVGSSSEVLRASRNVEVALVLDTTGSMEDSIGDLHAAAVELVQIVVQEQQEPFYSKVALAPYAWAVKLDKDDTAPHGALANAARGDITKGTSITGAGWLEAAKSISTVSRANTAEVRSDGHGLKTGDRVRINDVKNITFLNTKLYNVTRVDDNRFRLDGANTSGQSKNGSGGTFQKCILSNCSVVITSANHGIADGDYAYIRGVSGLGRRSSSYPNINNNHFKTVRLDADRFSVGVPGANYYDYTSGGTAYCAVRGCEYFVFNNSNGGITRFPATNCVSERTGSDAYTDAAPGMARVGRVYSTTCDSEPITPLSSQRADLETRIKALAPAGNTAGQIGIGWGWYLVSPTFGSIFSGDARPAPYDLSKTLKAVVIMTDGEFNAPYCQDVAANTGSGSNSRINCSATNGSPFQQSVLMCEGMKAQGIVVYTVGFNLDAYRGKAGVDTAIEVMETCATSKDKHFFKADSGTDLKDAFKAIGRDITRLRIAR